MSRLILERKVGFRGMWNSEARFVVAGANEFSMSQQIDIFDYFSLLRIYNCIIISQEHYVINKEFSRPTNVNDVDTGMKFVVYTWFPYQSSNQCTEGMISPYWTLGLVLHKGTSPRTLTCFQERSLTVSMDVL